MCCNAGGHNDVIFWRGPAAWRMWRMWQLNVAAALVA